MEKIDWDLSIPYDAKCVISYKPISMENRFRLIMTCDKLFDGKRHHWGDSGFRAALYEYAGVPDVQRYTFFKNHKIDIYEDEPKYKGFSSTELKEYRDFKDVINQDYKNRQQIWKDWWGAAPCFLNFFDIDLFDAEQTPYCWFRLDGKVKPYSKDLGRTTGKMDYFKDELLWFKDEFPEVDVTIRLLLKEDTGSCLDIHVHNHKIEVEQAKGFDCDIDYDLRPGKPTFDKMWTKRKLNRLERKYNRKGDPLSVWWNNFRVVSLADLYSHYFTFEEAKFLIDEWRSTYAHGRRPLI